jgi:hypothetical protein
MTQVIAENYNSMLRYRGKIFFILVVGIAMLVSTYITLIHSTVINVVEREKIVNEIREKSTAVSELESSYFSMKDKINIELARAKGFQDSEVSSFISKKSLTALVSHNEL